MKLALLAMLLTGCAGAYGVRIGVAMPTVSIGRPAGHNINPPPAPVGVSHT